MKNLMITAAASALMLGAVACSQSSDDIEMGDANYGETETAATDTDTDGMETAETGMMDRDVADDTTTQQVETVYLASGEYSADELIGAEVIGADGDKIANVEDLLVNSSGDVDSVIFRAGDFIDMVGDKGALEFDQLDLVASGQDEPRFTVSMTDQAIQEVDDFEQDGLNDYRLASEMIGTTADLANSDDSARIEDIIITGDGSVAYAVISDPMAMEEMRQLAFNRISVEQGDGGSIVIDATAQDISMMPLFAYRSETSASGSAYGNRTDTGAATATPDTETGMDTETDMDSETDLTTPQ